MGPPGTPPWLTLAPSPGCVRELRIQDEEIVFHDLNLTAHGISHCPTCRDQPCQVPPPATPTRRSPLWPAHQGVGEGLRVCGLTGEYGGLPCRMGASARTLRAAVTCASAGPASQGAVVSTPRLCTVTQVCTTLYG